MLGKIRDTFLCDNKVRFYSYDISTDLSDVLFF